MSEIYPRIPQYRVPEADICSANVVQYWGFFSEEDLCQHPDSLLMMDVDFGRACSLRCPSCFRRSNPVDDDGYRDLTYAEMMRVVDEARGLGLREIKICGAGEPLENPDLLRFARDLTDRNVGLSIFTKGHVLGDDAEVAHLFGRYGIRSARGLCEAFYELKTSFLVSFQSPVPAIQDRLVGKVKGYSLKRNRALELLDACGFNKDVPTRLAMCANPMVRANVDVLFDIYVYARRRNILPVNAALMVSGKQLDRQFLKETDPHPGTKEELFARIYEFNLRSGLNTLDQLCREGISCMPGIHPCNQIAAGVYLTCNGTVTRCPGDSRQPLGNVQDCSIAEIWEPHRDWAFAGVFNCWCPFKAGITLPEGLQERVLGRLAGGAVPAGASGKDRS